MEKEIESAVAIIGDGIVTFESKAKLRKVTSELETAMLKMPQADFPIAHYFSKDVYAREMKMDKGNILIGKIHKHQNLNIISKGSVSVISIDGMMRLSAPATFVASAGVKRIIYAHEDTVWTTIHGTGETDLNKIEDCFIAKDYEEVYMAGPRTLSDAVEALGLNFDDLENATHNGGDIVPLPADTYSISIANSLRVT